MRAHDEHIDQLIREKMDTFEVSPPDHVWQGVVAGLDSYQVPKSSITKKIILWTAAAALVFALLGWLMLSPSNGISVDSQEQLNNAFVSENQQNEKVSPAVTEEPFTPKESKTLEKSIRKSTRKAFNAKSSEQMVEIPEASDLKVTDVRLTKIISEEMVVINEDDQVVDHQSIYNLAFLSFKDFTSLNLDIGSPTLLFYSSGQSSKGFNGTNPVDLSKEVRTKNQGRWSAFVGLSSEFILTTFDSITILNTYTLAIEPIYYFNKHWFVRFGIGPSSARDRGFAQLDYIINKYRGSYEDVYDITFDSIDNQVIPTYHTKTVEVWDSIRHLAVSEVTNRYAYLQIPLMFGYYHPNSKASINWYVFGGPTLNFQLSQWIDEPHPAESYVEILDLENRLPERNRFYMQLCLTAGIEYKLSDKIAMAIEPGYRYYVNSIYDNEEYNKSLSAFSLRVGAIIRLK